MTKPRPTTIAGYIDAAPPQAQPHLRALYALLKKVAPKAQEAIKWGVPFFVEPRFLFAFSAHKAHISFTPSPQGLEPFREQLENYQTTKGMLKIPYADPLPVDLIRAIAKQRLRDVTESDGEGFW